MSYLNQLIGVPVVLYSNVVFDHEPVDVAFSDCGIDVGFLKQSFARLIIRMQ